MKYEIVPATQLHVGPLIARLGHQAKLLIDVGRNPRREMRNLMLRSCHSRVALIDGVPMAGWGFVGGSLATETEAWLALADGARRFVRPIVTVARKELAEQLAMSSIMTKVNASDQRAQRFLEFLGFTIDYERQINDWDGRYFYPATLER